MQREELPSEQNLESTVSRAVQNDEAEAKKEKADTLQHQAPKSPSRVIIVDDPDRPWPLTIEGFFNVMVQLLNIVAILVFGVWAIRSYNEAVTANQLSSNSTQAAQQALDVAQAANALAMFQICQSNVDDKAQALQNCYPILDSVVLAQPLRNALNSDLGIYATQTTSRSLTMSVAASPSSLTSTTSFRNITSLTVTSTSSTHSTASIFASATSPGATSQPVANSSGLPTGSISAGSQNSSLSIGAIAGISVGSVFVAFFIIMAIVVYRRHLASVTSGSSYSI